MNWMTMLMSEAWESTLVMRTLQSWNSSSFILSLMAWEVSMDCHVRHAVLMQLTLWPTQTCTLSVSFPDTNWERLL